jgi:hypothetical protein
MDRIRAILLPGAVLPAQPAYEALIDALGPDVEAVAKDLELYADDEPPPGWSLDTEIDGVLREADARDGRGSILLAIRAAARLRWRSLPNIPDVC